MDRRKFVRNLALFAAAPAVIRVADLMPIKVPTWRLHGDGITDDSGALNALFDGERVLGPDGKAMRHGILADGHYGLSSPLRIKSNWFITYNQFQALNTMNPMITIADGVENVTLSYNHLRFPHTFREHTYKSQGRLLA